jgi:hypothetical protein
MKRLFAFGCSFTKYSWPTWADILGHEFDSYQNWGQVGAGNQFIMNSLIECQLKNNIGEDDTVAIMWSSFGREDRYVDHQWVTPGNIFQATHVYDQQFIKRFADVRGYYIRDLATMWLVDQFLEKIKCKRIYFSMVDFDKCAGLNEGETSEHVSDLLEAYQPLLEKVRPSVHRVIFDLDWDSRPLPDFSPPGTLKLWRIWYRDVRDSDWPDCANPADFHNLPYNIKDECMSKHGYYDLIERIRLQEKKIAQHHKDMLSSKKSARFDSHPTPAEHLEYLLKVCPEIELSKFTIDWVNQINHKGLNGESYDDLFTDAKTINSVPKRW